MRNCGRDMIYACAVHQKDRDLVEEHGDPISYHNSVMFTYKINDMNRFECEADGSYKRGWNCETTERVTNILAGI